uniref:Uncharacterized protein n=1 Tax=Oryza meridionalis TaxID=40149 RepID=A0A0E0ECC3_9ORYZ
MIGFACVHFQVHSGEWPCGTRPKLAWPCEMPGPLGPSSHGLAPLRDAKPTLQAHAGSGSNFHVSKTRPRHKIYAQVSVKQ